MTRTDRSGGMPNYVPLALRQERPDDRPDARAKEIRTLQERFAALNDWINAQGGAWLTSVPGEPHVRMECLPWSPVPERLGDLGYHLRPDGDGERILPIAIVERFGRAADGTLVPITVGSTLPAVHEVAHAGIVGVRRYSFLL
ncbi:MULTISPECIES: hypothetical protein [unclassified Bradyrhizobium]|uniref:hypothetical protein n=1 Tax=unclassified Bradyrhizobium TaxID=2631580 RepID=UPI0028E4983D|nr:MULTISPECIES: hypothetical protein [unclassified Bradyrhizobium]